jgi:hypothetical protein
MSKKSEENPNSTFMKKSIGFTNQIISKIGEIYKNNKKLFFGLIIASITVLVIVGLLLSNFVFRDDTDKFNTLKSEWSAKIALSDLGSLVNSSFTSDTLIKTYQEAIEQMKTVDCNRVEEAKKTDCNNYKTQLETSLYSIKQRKEAAAKEEADRLAKKKQQEEETKRVKEEKEKYETDTPKYLEFRQEARVKLDRLSSTISSDLIVMDTWFGSTERRDKAINAGSKISKEVIPVYQALSNKGKEFECKKTTDDYKKECQGLVDMLKTDTDLILNYFNAEGVLQLSKENFTDTMRFNLVKTFNNLKSQVQSLIDPTITKNLSGF